MMEIPYRPLGIITEIIEQMDLEVTYAYEDLVFISHNAFLLRMGESGEVVYLYFNEESQTDKRDQISEQLVRLGVNCRLKILPSGTYTIKPREDEKLNIYFNEKAAT
jgi:hypothetical protein